MIVYTAICDVSNLPNLNSERDSPYAIIRFWTIRKCDLQM